MITFRNAIPEDFETAFRFIQQLWSYNTYDHYEVYQVYHRVLEDPNSFFFFLEEDGELRGFCHGDYFLTFWMSGKTAYVSSLFTDPAWRGKGYGAAMLDHAAELARLADCKAMILDSGLPREEAHRFYENYGFTKSCYGFELQLQP